MLRDQMPNPIEGIVMLLLKTNATSAAAAIAHGVRPTNSKDPRQ